MKGGAQGGATPGAGLYALLRVLLERGDGEIRVVVWLDGEFVKCSVRDNGSAAPNSQPGCSLQIVEALSKALGESSWRKLLADASSRCLDRADRTPFCPSLTIESPPQ
jgi:hypothetical protein